MTIHTDTFPLVCQHAANNPHLAMHVQIKNGNLRAEMFNLTEDAVKAARLDVSCLFTEKQLAHLSRLPQPVKINLVDNRTFKHLLERLHPGEGVML